MLDFSDRTHNQLLDEMIAQVPNDMDKRPTSFIVIALSAVAWLIAGVYIFLNFAQRNAWGLTALGTFLDYKTAERNLKRKPATPAVRDGVFNIEVPLGVRFSTINGISSIIFTVIGLGTVDENGFYHIPLLSEEVGIVGNEYADSLLPVAEYIEGLEHAQLGDILISGTEDESDDELRERWKLSLLEKPFAGNIAACKKELLDLDYVGGVQVYPLWQGNGTGKCSVIDSNYNAMTPAMVKELQNYICPIDIDKSQPTNNGTGFAPMTARITVDTATAIRINLEASIKIRPTITIEQVRDTIENAFDEYLLMVRKDWSTPTAADITKYELYVYLSEVITLIQKAEGVVNVPDVRLNGLAQDIALLENCDIHQLPIKGDITIHEIIN